MESHQLNRESNLLNQESNQLNKDSNRINIDNHDLGERTHKLNQRTSVLSDKMREINELSMNAALANQAVAAKTSRSTRVNVEASSIALPDHLPSNETAVASFHNAIANGSPVFRFRKGHLCVQSQPKVFLLGIDCIDGYTSTLNPLVRTRALSAQNNSLEKVRSTKRRNTAADF
jgi:hypothetical protein